MISKEKQIQYLIQKLQRDIKCLESLGKISKSDCFSVLEILKESSNTNPESSRIISQINTSINSLSLPDPGDFFYEFGVPLKAISSSGGQELHFSKGNLLMLTEKTSEQYGLGFLQSNKNKTGIIDLSKVKLEHRYDDHIFEGVDQYAKNVPDHACSSLKSLAEYLTAPFKNDCLFQLRSIFSWICYHIVYDTDGFFGRSNRPICHSPEDVLVSRSSVCAGYSNLFLGLCNSAPFLSQKIKVQTVSGYGRGFGAKLFLTSLPPPGSKDYLGHAWNLVEVNNQSFFIESTWGAGHLDETGCFKQSFDSHHFLCSPEEFIYKHFPQEQSLQRLAKPLSDKAFCSLPLIYSKFFKWNGQLISHSSSPLTLNQSNLEPKTLALKISLDLFPPETCSGPFITATLRSEDSSTSVKALCLPSTQIKGRWDVYVPPTDSALATLEIFGFKFKGASSGNILLQYAVLSKLTKEQVSLSSPLPQTLNTELTSIYILTSPLTSRLQLLQNTDFIFNSADSFQQNSSDLILISPSNDYYPFKFNYATKNHTNSIRIDQPGTWSVSVKKNDPEDSRRMMFYPLYRFDAI